MNEEINSNFPIYLKSNLQQDHLIYGDYKCEPFAEISEKLINKYNIDPQLFNDKDVLKYMDGFDSSYDKMHIYNKNGNEHQQNKE